MKYLKKTWIRIIISLFAGSAITELIYIWTGDPNRPRGENSSIILLIFAFIVYGILTLMVKKSNKTTL
jgi:preprotein translocase subunit SecY